MITKLISSFFYDFECQQQDGHHVPNLVVAQSVCNNCKDDNNVTENSKCTECGSRCIKCNAYNKIEKEFEREICNSCGYREVVFKGDNTIDDFGNGYYQKTIMDLLQLPIMPGVMMHISYTNIVLTME